MKLPPFRFNIPVGQWIDLDGKLLKFARRARDRERRLVFEGTDGVPADMTDQELLELQQAIPARLKILTTAEALDRINEVARPRITALDNEHDGDTTRKRLDYIRGWEQCGRPPRTEASLAPIVLRVLEARRASGLKSVEAKAPSPREVIRWISDWLESEGNIDVLVPQTANCGNWNEKRDPVWHELLEKTVEEKYLVETQPTAVSVHAHVLVAFADHNAALPPADHLQSPSLRSVYREIEKIDAYTLDCTRLGRRAADIKWRPKGSSPATTRHNEVWEVDHTTVNAIVTDPNTGLPIGRPTVTCIIDRHTRCIVGIHIGFDAAGTFPMMQCLRNAIQSKDALLASVPEVKGPYPCFGTGDVLMADQGREFKSKSLLKGCLTIGIDIQYAPVLKAWYKGKIERFFRTLSRDVFHRVPGTTFANFFARNKETTPETVAVVTLDELRMHTVRYIVDVYHKRKHRGLSMPPLQAWAESVARHGMKMQPDPERVLAATSHWLYRTPQHYGIEFEGLIYNSPDVAAYRVRPRVGKERAAVRIVVDPLDLTTIRFLDPSTNNFITVPIRASMLGLLKGVTLEKHKLARALQRANEKELGGDVGLARAYTIIDRAMDAHGRQGGLANRREAARYWEAIIRARPPEDTPAFDTAQSASAITDGLFDEPGVPPGDVSETRPSDLGFPVPAFSHQMEAVLHTPPPASDGAPPAAKPRKRRKPVAVSTGMPVTAPAAGEQPHNDDDLEVATRRLGMNVRINGRKEQQE